MWALTLMLQKIDEGIVALLLIDAKQPGRPHHSAGDAFLLEWQLQHPIQRKRNCPMSDKKYQHSESVVQIAKDSQPPVAHASTPKSPPAKPPIKK